MRFVAYVHVYTEQAAQPGVLKHSMHDSFPGKSFEDVVGLLIRAYTYVRIENVMLQPEDAIKATIRGHHDMPAYEVVDGKYQKTGIQTDRWYVLAGQIVRTK